MKLVYITNTISGAGGVQRVLAVKTHYLVAHKGYDIAIVVTNAKAQEPIYYDFHPDIEIITIEPNRSPLFYYGSYKKLLNSALKKLKPDVVIMCDNGLKSFILPYITRKKYPLVYEMHVSKHILVKPTGVIKRFFRKYFIYKLMSYCVAKYNKFVVLTTSAMQEWQLNNIEVIPNSLWFNPNAFSTASNKIAIAVGRHVYEKGYDRMLEAWKLISDKHPDWILKIYGETNRECDLKLLSERLNITETVKFCSPQKDIETAYSEASINLLTSRYEGFGLVLIESAACGVPSVAFDCPVGPRGIINNGKDGFLIEDNDIKAFVMAVEKLIEDEELRVEMGKNAKLKAKTFALEPIMERWDELFKSLVNSK
ncbi:glycosyltransferase family 4 protein [Flavobacterium salilacus subsp. salilacus]|uniref:glycosyltransferase family 4 protein n=1 Tax=Flavobacterium TaxID=237 RepID=UPI001074F7D4|nr:MULTISPECIES: glycosyltransferase family 4 protein [Flavobacterium]KAF2516905.1 glycosyltransferase family 4 protein [Flavobacterium salilacus subsp. salilacus]MBE1615735.1 glycosyltransferase family 4 protein [Flavobacterium sp. SaA2.13]